MPKYDSQDAKIRQIWAVFNWLRGMDLKQRPPGYELRIFANTIMNMRI